LFVVSFPEEQLFVAISEGEGWFLAADSRDLLRRIQGILGELGSLAERGSALIALGEVWEAIDSIISDSSIEVSVELTIGFRQADDDGFEEGLFMGLRIDSDGLTLDELNTTYSPEVGSDHYTVSHGEQSLDRTLDLIDVNNWIAKLRLVKNQDNAKLEAYRNHL
jgi:hypothetical protein